MGYKFIFLVLAVISFNIGYSQSDTLNRKDEAGTKVGYWIVNFDNGKIKEEGNYIEGKKEGLWKSYYDNGNKQNEIIYVKNRPNGYAKFYYENGKISEEGLWKINKWVGEYKMYHQNGQLSYDWKYSEKGKRTGVQKYYHPNGKLMIEGKWNEGKEDGVVKQYDETGKLVSERTFNDGKQDPSSIKYYDTKTNENSKTDTLKEEPKDEKSKWPKGYQRKRLNGVIQEDGFYEKNKLKNGQKYYYDDEGNLEKTVIYKDFKISDIKYN